LADLGWGISLIGQSTIRDLGKWDEQ